MWIFDQTLCTDADQSLTIRTLVDRTTPSWEQHCWPPTMLSCAAAAAVSFNREDVEWAKYKTNGVWCNHWCSCCNVICMCWIVWHPRCLLVADWPSVWDLLGGINQTNVCEIIVAVLHSLSDCVLAYYVRSCKCCMNWVCACDTCTARYVRSLGIMIITRLLIPRSISRYRLMNMNPSVEMNAWTSNLVASDVSRRINGRNYRSW